MRFCSTLASALRVLWWYFNISHCQGNLITLGAGPRRDCRRDGPIRMKLPQVPPKLQDEEVAGTLVPARVEHASSCSRLLLHTASRSAPSQASMVIHYLISMTTECDMHHSRLSRFWESPSAWPGLQPSVSGKILVMAHVCLLGSGACIIILLKK